MRIALIGQQAFARDVLHGLQENGHEIAGVFTDIRDENAPDPLADAAKEAEIPLYRPHSFKQADAIEQMRALAPELCVMAFVTKIVPDEMIAAPTLGTIQFHPSLLPRHRGGSAINWAMLMGDSHTGVTIFWPDGGLDTGPILLERSTPIAPDDTIGTLYFNKLYPLGVEAMLEAVSLVSRGIAPRIPQDPGSDTYEPLCKGEHARLDWNQPYGAVYDRIRGTDPQPGAWAELDGHTVQLFDASPRPDGQGRPGEILDTADGLVVACAQGAVAAGRVRVDGGKKTRLGDLGADTPLKAGASLT